MNLSQLSIAELNLALQRKALSATDIAQQTLQGITQVNPILNAWTEITRERMLKKAKTLDQQRQQSLSLPVLAGIPYAVKNLFDVANHTTLAGAKLLSQRAPAREDCYAVQQLDQAGALLSGMLNMDAYAYGFTTENSHYGATRNPHNLQCIAGGSSGGSAAAVASGLAHFSLGTDTNGSIRVPASLCGIYGLKPTFGRLSRRGSHPFVPSLDHIGVMARNVSDIASVYNVLQGYDDKDPFQRQHPTQCIVPDHLARQTPLRCATLTGYFNEWCNDHARQALQQVARALSADQQVDFIDAQLSRHAAFIISAAEGGNQYLSELQRHPDLFDPHSRERLLAGAMIPSAWYLQSQRFRRKACETMKSLFQHTDILLAPATPCAATPIGQAYITINHQSLPVRASLGLLTQPLSFLGLPVLTVPVRLAGQLPIGVQIIAAPFQEQHCFQAAWQLERMAITDGRAVENLQ